MSESTEQKSGRTDQKIESDKVIPPGSSSQNQAKPENKQSPEGVTPSSGAVPPLKADAGVKSPQK